MTFKITACLLFFLSLNTSGGEYIVCQDIGAGKIKCEDGVYGKTAEVGFAINAARIIGNSSKDSREELPDVNCDESNLTGPFDSESRIICGDARVTGNARNQLSPPPILNATVPQQTDNNGGGLTGAKQKTPTTRENGRSVLRDPRFNGQVDKMTDNNGGGLTGAKQKISPYYNQ